MGVDLQLLPFDAGENGIFFSHTILSCERRSELWPAIQEIEDRLGVVVPAHFSTFLSDDGDCDEAHYGETTHTPYGERLKYISVNELNKLIDHPAVRDNWKNRAIWGYLQCLPANTKVALYWH